MVWTSFSLEFGSIGFCQDDDDVATQVLWVLPPHRDSCAKILLNDVIKSVWFLCAYSGLLWFLHAATIYSPWQALYNDIRDPANNNKEKIMTLDEFLAFAKNASGVGIYINIQVIHLEFSLQ